MTNLLHPVIPRLVGQCGNGQLIIAWKILAHYVALRSFMTWLNPTRLSHCPSSRKLSELWKASICNCLDKKALDWWGQISRIQTRLGCTHSSRDRYHDAIGQNSSFSLILRATYKVMTASMYQIPRFHLYWYNSGKRTNKTAVMQFKLHHPCIPCLENQYNPAGYRNGTRELFPLWYFNGASGKKSENWLGNKSVPRPFLKENGANREWDRLSSSGWLSRRVRCTGVIQAELLKLLGFVIKVLILL